MMNALFAKVVPDGCPDDPIEKQRYLTAQATARLLLDEALAGHPGVGPDTPPADDAAARDTTGDPGARRPSHDEPGRSGPSTSRPRPGRPEFVAVIDADAPDQTGPVCEFSIPVEIPARILATLTGTADIHTVVVRNGVVLHAPGELNLGSTTRLANRAQHRALRGLYRTCAIPGCGVHYDRCKLHHIIWWRNQGRTDLDNLLPVCSVHHTKIHHDDWHIELGPNRELTLRLPDGSIHTTGPPTRRQPAA
jgi:hypothetical protein